MLVVLFLGNGTVEYNEFIRMMNRYSEKTANCPDAEMLEAFKVCLLSFFLIALIVYQLKWLLCRTRLLSNDVSSHCWISAWFVDALNCCLRSYTGSWIGQLLEVFTSFRLNHDWVKPLFVLKRNIKKVVLLPRGHSKHCYCTSISHSSHLWRRGFPRGCKRLSSNSITVGLCEAWCLFPIFYR